jgi:hypothetical protein
VDPGVTRSHGRAHGSNYNQHLEASPRTSSTLRITEQFGSVKDARVLCTGFFAHYDRVFRHRLLAPKQGASQDARAVGGRGATGNQGRFNIGPDRRSLIAKVESADLALATNVSGRRPVRELRPCTTSMDVVAASDVGPLAP